MNLMFCPMCHNPVIGVFHEWRGSENRVIFEYLHAEVNGVRHEPCLMETDYEQGLKKYECEWLEMYPTTGRIH